MTNVQFGVFPLSLEPTEFCTTALGRGASVTWKRHCLWRCIHWEKSSSKGSQLSALKTLIGSEVVWLTHSLHIAYAAEDFPCAAALTQRGFGLLGSSSPPDCSIDWPLVSMSLTKAFPNLEGNAKKIPPTTIFSSRCYIPPNFDSCNPTKLRGWSRFAQLEPPLCGFQAEQTNLFLLAALQGARVSFPPPHPHLIVEQQK